MVIWIVYIFRYQNNVPLLCDINITSYSDFVMWVLAWPSTSVCHVALKAQLKVSTLCSGDWRLYVWYDGRGPTYNVCVVCTHRLKRKCFVFFFTNQFNLILTLNEITCTYKISFHSFIIPIDNATQTKLLFTYSCL